MARLPKSPLVLAFCTAAGLPACTTLADRPVEGWPQLTITEHYVSDREVRERCLAYPTFGSTPMACARFNLPESRCDIWYSTSLPLRSYVLAHERRHCQGYNHAGEHNLEEVLKAHRAKAASG